MLVRAVLFDYDGLIFDSEKLYYRFWIEAAHHMGLELRTEDALKLRSCDSQLARDIIKDTFNDQNVYDELRRIRKELMSSYLLVHRYELKPGIKELLAYLHTNLDVKLLVVTSSNAESKRVTLQEYGLLKYFNDVLSTEVTKRGKPYPDVYTYSCELINEKPENCIALEDSPNGVESAFAAGLNVFMIPDLSKPDTVLASKCSIFGSLLDVRDYFVKLNHQNVGLEYIG